MAPRLKAANLAKTTLASPCSAASTTITVSSSAGFPEPPFRVFVGSEQVAYEIMEVTAVNGDTWTVIRGLEGTQAKAWEAGTRVENRFTAGTFSELAKSPHADEHRPGGTDPLATGTPAGITPGASASEGTAQAFARADHVHATPGQWPPTAHAASHESGGSDALNPENIGANWNRLVNKPSAFPPEAHAASHESGGADAINPSNIGANWNLLVNKPSSFPPESHASSHQPGGSDALPTGIPSQITVGATSSEGTSQAFARADHVHATPDTWPPTPHASLHEEGGSDALNPANLGANWNKIINKPEAYPPEYHATSHEAGGSDALNPNNIGANWDLLVNKPNTFPPEAHSANHIPGGTDALPTGSPSNITPGSTSSEGTASSFARSDHVHATPETWPPSAHASSHESGGVDELNVSGLQGVLADFQKAKIGVIANKADFPSPGIPGRLAWAQDEQALYQDTGTAWTKVSPYTFLELSDTPGTYSGQGGKVVRVKTSEDGLEFVSVAGGAARFTELEDTPSSYSGQALKYVRVNSDETGLEFVSAVGGAGNFLELSDTPNSYSGASGYLVRVKTTTDGLEFINPASLPVASHASSHEEGGTDAINPANIGANWNKLVNKPAAFPPESHATAHQPGGSDALLTGAPAAITVGATGSEGTATSFARSDHVHATPETWPPTAHAHSHQAGGSDEISVAGLSGELADYQKAKLAIVGTKSSFPSPGVAGRLAYAADENALYRDTGSAWEKVHPTSFLELTDTPSSYSGNAGKVVRVKSDASGLEFADVAGGAATFIGLTDTPSSYTGFARYVPRVNSQENGLEWATVTGVTPGPITIYVDATNGSDTTGDGSSSAPFKTIQKAIDWFKTNAPVIAHDCTIAVGPGTYTLSSSLDTSGLLVTGSLTIEARDTSGRALYDYGTATGGSSTTLIDTSKSWPADFWAGGWVFLYQGTGAGEIRTISSNTSNTLTISSGTAPSTNTKYVIVKVTIDANNSVTPIFKAVCDNLRIKGFNFVNSPVNGYIISTVAPLPGHRGLLFQYNLVNTNQNGLYIDGFHNFEAYDNFFRVGSYGVAVGYFAYGRPRRNCFQAATSGTGTGLYVYGASCAALVSGGDRNTFLNLSYGIRAILGGIVYYGSAQSFSGCTTNYMPAEAPDPSYIS